MTAIDPPSETLLNPTCDEGIEAMDEDDETCTNPKKRRGKATRWKIPPTALQMLEQVFKVDKFPSVETRKNLATNLKVTPRQVQVWFQNKRQRAVVPAKTHTPCADIAMTDVKGRMGGVQIPPSGAVDATLQQRDVFAGEYVAPDPNSLLPSLQETSLAEMYLTLCQMRQIALPTTSAVIPQSVHPHFGTRIPAAIQPTQHSDQMLQCAVQQPNQQPGRESNKNELPQLQPTSAAAGANGSGAPVASPLANVWGVGGASSSGGNGPTATSSLYPPLQLSLGPGSSCTLGGPPSHPIVLGLPLGHLAIGSNPSEALFDAPAPSCTAPHSFAAGTSIASAFAGPPNLTDVPPGLLLAASNATFATSDPSNPHSWASSLRMQQLDVAQVMGGIGGLTGGFGGGGGSLGTANVSTSLPANTHSSNSSLNIASVQPGTASSLSAPLSSLAAHVPLLSAEHAAALAASANEAASFQATSLFGAVHSASFGPSVTSVTKNSVDVATRDQSATTSTSLSASTVRDGQESPAAAANLAAGGSSCGALSPIDSFGSLLEMQRALFDNKATTVSQLNDLLRQIGANSALVSPELVHVQQQLGLEQQLSPTASLGISMANPNLSVSGSLFNAMSTSPQANGRSPSETIEAADVAEEFARGDLHGRRLSTQQMATNSQIEGGVYDELINSLFDDESTSHYQAGVQSVEPGALQLDHPRTDQITSLCVSSASLCAHEQPANPIEQSDNDQGLQTADGTSGGNVRQNAGWVITQPKGSRSPHSCRKTRKPVPGSGSPDSSQSDLSTADILQLRDDLLENV